MMKKATWMVFAVVALAGCDPEDDGIKGVTAPTGFAVTHSDYDAAGAIALLGPDGALEQERFIHSGTVFEGLGSALSSDVVLPTVSGPDGVLTYLERFGTNMVTRIDIAAGEVLGQTLTDESDTDGYDSNPYDVSFVDDTHAWVTRYAPNTEVAASDENAGNDLVLFDLESAEISERISFDAMNDTGTVVNMDTQVETEVVVYARPGRMVSVGDHAVVALERIDLTFKAYGTGMVAIVDLDAKTATSLELEGLKNCGGLSPVADDATRVIVTCVGEYFPADQRDAAGIAIVHVANGTASVEHTWIAAEHPDDALVVAGTVSLGGTRAAVVAAGDFATVNDQVYVLDVESGELEMIADSEGSFVLGSGAYNAADKVLLLPDASSDAEGVVTGGLRRFQWDDAGEVTELDIVETDSDLPPRTVAALQ